MRVLGLLVAKQFVHPHQVRIIGIQRDHEEFGARFFGKAIRVRVDDVKEL